MTTEQLDALKAMPPGARISLLLRKKIENNWSQEQYAAILRQTHVPDTRISDAPSIGEDENNPLLDEVCEAGSESRPTSGEADVPFPPHTDVASHPIATKGLSQKARILELLQDGNVHSTVEIMNRVYRIGEERGNCNIKARIHELRQEGHDIPEAIHIKGTLYGYRLNKVSPFYGG